jgi:hypothetical protein
MARTKAAGSSAPEVCPVCGEDVPPRALACPECGADDRSGWSETAASDDSIGSADEEFDYDRFVREEFGSSPKPAGLHPIWWISGILLLLAFLISLVSPWG